MKTIGLIGGMSWQWSIEYYRVINERVAARCGGLHSAECVLYSFDFDEIDLLQRRGDWQKAARRMVEAAQAVEQAGADFLVLCTNTMHKVADAIEAAVGIPLLHIADATAERIKAGGLHKVGLLGTRFTMEEPFYRGRLVERHGLEVVIPDERTRQLVHDLIYNDLCRGETGDQARSQLIAAMQALAAHCEGIILGCTELGLVVKPKDSPVPLFDTTVIHAEAAAEFALH